MELQKILELGRSERETLEMILSNCCDMGSVRGAMISINAFPRVANDLIEWGNHRAAQPADAAWPDDEMGINEVVKRATDNARRHDWHKLSMLEHLALFTEEIGEACDCIRNGAIDITTRPSDGKPEGLPTELADLIIRVCYMAGRFNLPLYTAIKAKLAYNETRPRNHDKKI